MSEILHIFSYKFLSFLKVNVDWKPQSVAKNIGSFFIYTGFAVGAFFATRETVGFLLGQMHIGIFLLHRFLSMLLFILFLSINAGNIIVSYSTLYKSPEVSYLLTMPVKHITVFVIKFLENFFYSSTTLVFVSLAVLFGYGSYFQYSWTFYAGAILFLVIPFMLLAALIGVMVLMGIIALAGRLGARVVVSVIAAVYGASVFLFFKITNPGKLVGDVMKFYPNVDQYFGFLDPPSSKFLPNYWISEALYWIAAGDISKALPFTGVLLGGCSVAFILVMAIARRGYYSTWLTSLTLRVRKESASRLTGAFGFAEKSSIDAQSEVLLKKEFWQFFREPSQWIHLVVILFLMGLFVASIINIDTVSAPAFLRTVSYLVIFLFNAFLVSSMALRFVYPIISIEGEAFWKIRSAPLDVKKLGWLKLSAAFVILLLIAEILNGIVHIPLSGISGLAKVSAVNVFFLTIAFVTLSFGMGSFFATFKEKNPIRVASSQGASLNFLVSLAYMVVLVALLFFPLNRYFEGFVRGRGDGIAVMWIATGVVGAMSLLMGITSVYIGMKALKRDF